MGSARPASLPSQSHLSEQSGQYNIGVEAVTGNFGRGVRVALVVSVDRLDGLDDLFHRREAEQTRARLQDVAKPSLLSDHRPARRQVGSASVAEPAAA